MKRRGSIRQAAVFALFFVIVCLTAPAPAEDGENIKFSLMGAMYLNADTGPDYNEDYCVTLYIDVSDYRRVSFPVYFKSPACAMVYDRDKNVIDIIQDVPYGIPAEYTLPWNAKYLSISVERSHKNQLTVLGYETLPDTNSDEELFETEQNVSDEPAQPEEESAAEEKAAGSDIEKTAGDEPAQPEEEKNAEEKQEKTEEEKAAEEEAAFKEKLNKNLKAMEKEQLRQDDWPLETIIHDGGMAKIFRTIGVVGDSLSSGAMTYKGAGEESRQINVDMYEYSWIQYMARYCGSTAYNFSVSGMGTDNFFGSEYYDLMIDGEHLCQANFIALGHNDYNRSVPIGAIEDIDLENWENNAKTYMGNYARIISSIKSIQPTAKIFPS